MNLIGFLYDEWLMMVDIVCPTVIATNDYLFLVVIGFVIFCCCIIKEYFACKRSGSIRL